jgi:GMP synthase (glutamine-hydrolysing)
MLPVQLTDAARTDPVFATLPGEFVALQWHSDTYELPDGAVALARSAAYPQQAFAVHNAYAMQFHLEIDAAGATTWGEVPAYERSLEELLGPHALAGLIDDLRGHQEQTTRQARRLFAAWLERVVGLEPVAVAAAT